MVALELDRKRCTLNGVAVCSPTVKMEKFFGSKDFLFRETKGNGLENIFIPPWWNLEDLFFPLPILERSSPPHSSRSKKMKRDVRRGSFHHAWRNFVNSYPSIRLLQTATFEITVAPFPAPPPHLVDTLLKRDESGRGQGTVMGHYFCRGN